MSSLVDIDLLNNIGEFCMTYGPWAGCIFLGLYILKKDRVFAKWRKETSNTFQEYHEEQVKLVKSATKGLSATTSAINKIYSIIKRYNSSVDKLIGLLLQHPRILEKLSQADLTSEETQIITDFINGENNGKGV